jgi:hypothetical protein
MIEIGRRMGEALANRSGVVVLRVGVPMHRRQLGIVGPARFRSASFPCFWRSEHVLEGHRIVIIDDRVMSAALAAF